MSDRSLDAAYFEGIFASDDDPWQLASSAYERAKFDQTIAALGDCRYRRAIEIGCAHGVLTARLLAHCDTLLAIDISAAAIAKARSRLGTKPGLTLARMAFPREAPPATGFELAVLSEVAYYWSDEDLERAAQWLETHVDSGGYILLVHYTGETDYPQSGDRAVGFLKDALGEAVAEERGDRHDRYRLDLWRRR
ncbi:SAM-dependent methyltransferase [Novosphingobium decolorationis]|uniref:Methyltransferase domain-containing protein n=1 Tax=Novosphingobium decolorationis TaxID=2698673 RepID=A0ABX8E1A6_9SPHN|nr:SAM-dependent methyltransferase [Novosphingobium decolorationis]QVM82369.1 methyltransferase domain-containing protein [Novosphingobium decolorationis]